MWWNTSGPAPWMIFASVIVLSVIVILFPAICVAIALVARRGMSHLSLACCGAGFGPGKRHGSGIDDEAPRGTPSKTRRSAFDDYRADTLRRLEQERIEFDGFLDHLRGAKDKAEFDQFMAERKPVPPAPESRPPA
jgi:uncharacterized protein DUF2852